MLLPIVAILLMMSGCASTGSNRGEAPKRMSSHERAMMLINLAAANITEGDGTQALQALKESEEIDNSIPETYYLYSLAYHLKGEKGLAVQSVRKAIELRPNYSKAKNTLGKLLLDQGKYAEAEKFLKEAVADLLFDEAYLAKANLGILYYKQMNYEKAMPFLTQALREGGRTTCVAAYYRGQIYLEKNQLDYALADFNRSSKESCARISDAHLAKGQTLIRMKKYDQARAKMLEIEQLFPLTEASEKAAQYLKEIP